MSKLGLTAPAGETGLLQIVTSTGEEAVLLFDRFGGLIWASPQARRILDLPSGLAPRSSWEEIFPFLSFPLDIHPPAAGEETAPNFFSANGPQVLPLCVMNFWYPRARGGRRYLRLVAKSWKTGTSNLFVALAIRDETTEVSPWSEQNNLCRLFGLVGISRPMQQTFRQLWETTLSGNPLWVEGRSGVGKKEVARTLHALLNLPANNCLFVPCATIGGNNHGESPIIPEIVSFVSSGKSAPPKAPHIVTIIFHGLGYLSRPVQAWLATFIEEAQLTFASSSCSNQPPQLQIVALSTRPLRELWSKGVIIPELYFLFRENVCYLPPLAERPEDVPVLAHHFLNMYAAQNGVGPRHISSAALAKLLNSSWPGNVAQLKTAILCACALAEGDTLMPTHLPPELVWEANEDSSYRDLGELPAGHTPSGSSDNSRGQGKSNFTEHQPHELCNSPNSPTQVLRLRTLLLANNWNVAKTARQLGVSRTTVYKWIERWKLQRPASP